jgi:hypothetical protein
VTIPEVIAERSGHPVYDAILALAEQAYQQGRAAASGDWSRSAEAHRAVLLALADLQDLIPALAAEASPAATSGGFGGGSRPCLPRPR